MMVNSNKQPGLASGLGVIPAGKINPLLTDNTAALRQAAKYGITMSELPMAYDRSEQITQIMTEDIAKEIAARLADLQSDPKRTMVAELLAGELEKSLIHNVNTNIDGASLAAASVIMPRLTKPINNRANDLFQDWSEPAAKVLPDILSGLGEGTGESLAEDLAQMGKMGKGLLPSIGSGTDTLANRIMPQPQDYNALEPGRENIPIFDMSPKQKAAFAQQQLERQLGEPPSAAKGNKLGSDQLGGNQPADDQPADNRQPGRNQGTPTQPTSSMDELLQLQQAAADEGKNFQASGQANLEERLHHSGIAQAHAKQKRYEGLLAADKKYSAGRQKRSGGSGSISQSLTRKAAYFMGLQALEKQARKVGHKLQNNIEHGKFTGYIFALALALIVDAIAIGALFVDGETLTGVLMWIVDAVLIIILAVILFGHGHYFMSKLVKRLFGKQIVRLLVAIFGLFAEFVPVAGALPMWTVNIIWMKYDVDKMIKEHKKDVHSLENDIKKEIKRMKRSGQVNERKLTKLKNRLDALQKKAYA